MKWKLKIQIKFLLKDNFIEDSTNFNDSWKFNQRILLKDYFTEDFMKIK